MPTIVNTEGNRFISFAIGDDHALWYQESDDTFSWGDWKTLGGNLLQIVIMRSKIVGVEVFAIDQVMSCFVSGEEAGIGADGTVWAVL